MASVLLPARSPTGTVLKATCEGLLSMGKCGGPRSTPVLWMAAPAPTPDREMWCGAGRQP
jgi:hypothetical protein